MNRMGVFIITPVFHPEIGGIESHLLDLCKVLSRRDDVQCVVATCQPIFTLKRNDLPVREQMGCFDVHRFKWIFTGLFDRLARRSPLMAELYLAPYFALRTLFLFIRHRRDIQIIHSQGLMAAGIGRMLAFLFGKKMIVSTHSFYGLVHGAITQRTTRAFLRSAFRVLCLSDQSLEEVRAIGVKPGRSQVYRYWIDEERFHPAPRAECRTTLGWPDKFTILFSGRFLEVKGIPILLNILPRLGPDVHVVLVGGGPMEAEIRARLAPFPNATLMPPKSNDEIYRIYSAADVLVVPSTWQEGLGRVILEAMTCGVPVIGSNRGGIPEVVNEATGILIEPVETELLQAIQSLQNDPQRCRRLGAAARQYALERFSSRNAAVIIKAYQDAVA